MEPEPRQQKNRYEFPPTSIMEVNAARGGGAESDAATASLCEKYWFPLYAFLRRRGSDVESAKDLTQGFFEQFLRGKGFSGFEPSRGRLRSYLLGALKNYEAECQRHRATQKRGGNVQFVSFDWLEAESRYAAEPEMSDSPDLLYDRHWARTLMAEVDAELRHRYHVRGKGELYDVLSEFLEGTPPGSSQAMVARNLGSTEAAVKMAISRMRNHRLRILRTHVSATVNSEELVDEEVAYVIGLYHCGQDA